MELDHCTWPEVGAYLKKSTGILVPIGSTEQHGPNGLMGTDSICSKLTACAAADKVNALVAPTIPVGIAQHHMGFSGTMTIRPSTLVLLIKEWVFSLAHHGFEKFFFVNGHGGNIATIGAAFSEIYGERSLAAEGDNRPDLRCRQLNWWESPAAKKIVRELYGANEGMHAACSEVAVTQFSFPEHIKNVVLDPPVAPGPNRFTDAPDFRRKFPDGRIGSNPSLATPEAGKRLVEAAAGDIADAYTKFIES
ncbi:MAG TPA: creatininase family protein [Sneathiellales bacterium]|nr:creatininase family protein [Sneathiellales bacterium]